MITTLSGGSDDLVELDGELSEEWTYDENDDAGMLVAFSTGTVLRIRYSDEGIWRITHVTGPAVPIDVVPEDESRGYTDKADVDNATWAVVGTGIVLT